MYIAGEPINVSFLNILSFFIYKFVKMLHVVNGLTLKRVNSWSVFGNMSAFNVLMRTVAWRKTLEWMFSVQANFFFCLYFLALCVTNWLLRPFVLRIRLRAAVAPSPCIYVFTFLPPFSMTSKCVFACGQCKYLQLPAIHELCPISLMETALMGASLFPLLNVWLYQRWSWMFIQELKYGTCMKRMNL